VRCEDQGFATFSVSIQSLPKHPPGYWIQPCGGLIQEYNRWVTNQCDGCA